MTRRIAVLTTGRQDYGLLRSTIAVLSAHPTLTPLIWAGGMHLSHAHGHTIDLVRSDGATPSREIPFLSEPAEAIRDTAQAVVAIGAALVADMPDALLLVGDRTETLAAALAATLHHVPIVHIHGGEETEGAIDNALRHAITKLSHLHLVTHPIHAARVLQMGEDPGTVFVVGAPGLDNMFRDDLASRTELSATLGGDLRDPIVIVTMHSATLDARSMDDVRAVGEAMSQVDATYVITAPNSDSGGDAIRDYWMNWRIGRQNVVFVDAMGERVYWGLLREAAVVLGNSSSGIIEAPVAGAAVINVGDRQQGRLRWGPVVDVKGSAEQITSALRASLASRVQPRIWTQGAAKTDASAAAKIASAIASWTPSRPLRKRFNDLQRNEVASV